MRWAVVRQLSVIAALALVAAILWIDVATGLWQDYVILSGLAAGVVTFIFTPSSSIGSSPGRRTAAGRR